MQGAEVSLSGNLGFVSLDEVLRLLTRSKQSGAVDVKGDRVHGRIFVERRGIGLATTYTDETLRRHLTRSGLLDSEQLSDIVAGTSDIASMAQADKIAELLHEISVEGLYQLGLHGSTFEVFEGETTVFASPKAFDLEDLLSDSKQRLTDWEEVKLIVSDLDRELRLERELGERDEVTIDRDSWRIVSDIGQGSSISDLADHLGTTQFWTARTAARLIENGLMSLDATEPVEEWIEPEAAAEEVAEVETPAESYEEPTLDPAELIESEPVEAEVAAAEAEEYVEETQVVEEVVDPNQSWWKEPEVATAIDDELVEPVFSEASMTDPVWADQPSADTSEVEEDTETFLEKVFSEMEPTAESDEGYGLLRRRRMGAIRDNTPAS